MFLVVQVVHYTTSGGAIHCVVTVDLQNYFCQMAVRRLQEGYPFKKLHTESPHSEQQLTVCQTPCFVV